MIEPNSPLMQVRARGELGPARAEVEAAPEAPADPLLGLLVPGVFADGTAKVFGQQPGQGCPPLDGEEAGFLQ
jgi:hypothetical protein